MSLKIPSVVPCVNAYVMGVLAVVAGLSCNAVDEPDTVQETRGALTAPYDWMQFYGNSAHTGDNTLETTLTAQNVSTLGQLFQVPLPGKADGPPAILTNVSTASGVRDLAFLTTQQGHILALDAHTGAPIWSQQYTGPNFTTSSPAVDPGRAFVYSYGLDGAVHKYAVGTGVETTTGGWPAPATAKPSLEKGSTSLTITSAGANNYLHIGYSGYGDGGDYQGHLTTINLANGQQKVFNAVCSDQPVHFVTGGAPDCAFVQSAIWGRSAAVYDADTGKIYAGTGNGTFDPTTHQWGDTVLALNPDGSGTATGPLDSYTPSIFNFLQAQDYDLGSASPTLLPGSGTVHPHVALQAGKDSVLRLIDLDNMSGQGGPGFAGGELSQLPLPVGTTVATGMPTWINPADNSTWVFVASYGGGLMAFKLLVDGNGIPSLGAMWQQTGAGGSLLVANNVLYSAINNSIRALTPTTGAVLWSASNIGVIHWQSPVVANGILYIADNNSQLTAYSIGQAAPPVLLPRTGWVASASKSSTTDTPPKALDGSLTTRFTTGAAMAAGMWFQVDMAAATSVSEVVMDSNGTGDYARAYSVYVTNDPANLGVAVTTGTATATPVTASFTAKSGRYIRVVLGTVPAGVTSWWSIHEFNAYGASGGGGTGAGGAGGGGSAGAGGAGGGGSAGAGGTGGGGSAGTGGTGGGGSAGTGGTGGAAGTGVFINSGGSASAPYVADVDFVGGTTLNHANAIDVSGVSNPAPAAVYQTARTGNFTYTIPGFVAGSAHTVRLHFCETYFSTSGSRTFNVTINGTQVLTAFDVYAAAGAKNKAVVRPFTVNANSTGQFVLQLKSVVNNSLLSGIEIH